MTHTLNLKITHNTDTEHPFFMVTPTFGRYDDEQICYPLFVGTLEEVAKFCSQCCNVTTAIDIEDLDVRVKMSQAINQ